MFNFLYNFLFIDQKEGHMSHSKFWSHCGYGIMCWSFVYVILQGSTEIDYMLWLLFGGVVVGNRSINKYLSSKAEKRE